MEEARGSLNTALNIQPDNPFFLYAKGLALAKSGSRKETE
jgi:hypothetical protein